VRDRVPVLGKPSAGLSVHGSRNTSVNEYIIFQCIRFALKHHCKNTANWQPDSEVFWKQL
jgi:hypothetical protein